jgi:hypothetical protein
MSDIGIVGILSASGTSGSIEFETQLSEIIVPNNSIVRVGIISNRKSVTYTIEQDTASNLVNVPAFTFEDYGTTESGDNLTVLKIETDDDYQNTVYKLKATVNADVYAYSRRFEIRSLPVGAVTYNKTVSIDQPNATLVVLDNAAQSFNIPILRTFEVNNLQAQGQVAYTSPGTYTWNVPSGVTEISMVAIGGGGAGGGAYGTQLGAFWGKGGAGAGLAWGTASVTSGDSIKIEVGEGGVGQTGDAGLSGQPSRICHMGNNCQFMAACGGGGGSTSGLNNYEPLSTGGQYIVDSALSNSGGGNGGSGGGTERATDSNGAIVEGWPGGGGGTAGYSGTGGAGGPRSGTAPYGLDGSGGGGAGGYRQCGGGTGLWQVCQQSIGGNNVNGYKGSNGSTGALVYKKYGANISPSTGWFGHGASGYEWPGTDVDQCFPGPSGGDGAVRIIWGGGREYEGQTIQTPQHNDDVYEVEDGTTLNFNEDTPIISYKLTGTIPTTVDTDAINVDRESQFESGSNVQNIVIPVLDDAISDIAGSNTGTFTFNLTASTDNYTVSTNTTTLGIQTNPNPPIREVGWLSPTYNIDEGETISVKLLRTSIRNGTSDLGLPITVFWSIRGENVGDDPDDRWNTTSGSTIIPAGETEATINLSIAPNNTQAPSSTNIIEIDSVSDARYTITGNSLITINNLYKLVRIASSAIFTEGETGSVTLSRVYKRNGADSTPDDTTVISWGFGTALNDDRVSLTSGTVSIAGTALTNDINIPVQSTPGLQTSTFNTIRILNATSNYVIDDANNTSTIRINDTIEEVKTISISTPNVSVDEGNTFTVLLQREHLVDGISSLSDRPTIAWTLTNADSRFVGTSGVSAWQSGETDLSISIPTQLSEIYIGDATATFTIYNPSLLYEIEGNNSITLTLIEDDDEPTIDVTFDNEIVRGGQSITATVSTQSVLDGSAYKYYINHNSTNNFDFTSDTSSPISFNIVNTLTDYYTFTGNGLLNFNNPNLTLIRGRTYRFSVNAPGHPFYIKTDAVAGNVNTYPTGVTGQGVTSGVCEFTVPLNAPNRLYYQCSAHLDMGGQLNMVDESIRTEPFYIQENSGSFTILTTADSETIENKFSISILDGLGNTVHTTDELTIKPTVEFRIPTLVYDEGTVVTANIDCASQGTHSYAVSGTNIDSGDFITAISGTFTPQVNAAYYGFSSALQFPISNDNISEGVESFKITITDPDGNVFDSNNITINDTSETPSTGTKSFTSNQEWVVPGGVSSISAVVIGGGGGGAGHMVSGTNPYPQTQGSVDITNTGSGGGGGGGAVAWAESIPVTAGETLSITVGAGGSAGTAIQENGGNGGESNIRRSSTKLLAAGGGGGGKQTWATFTPFANSTGGNTDNGGAGGSNRVYDATTTAAGNTGGGDGGIGGHTDGQRGGGGGGAGGYQGSGGSGAGRVTSNPGNGSGGGGGGAHESANFYYTSYGQGYYDPTTGGGGGGVGVNGVGVSGNAGSQGASSSYTSDKNGSGGSGGANGTGTGGEFGGGGGGSSGGNSTGIPNDIGAAGSRGIVRVIWGAGYSYPNNAI